MSRITTTRGRGLAVAFMAALVASGCAGPSGSIDATATTTPLVVEFSPAVAREFIRPRSPFAAPPGMTQAQYSERNTLPKPIAGRAQPPRAYADPEVIASFLTDRTVLSHSAQHGTQVEYISPSGETFLWYPGNDQVLRGRFAVLWENASAEIADPQEGNYRGQIKINYVCFRYASSTQNPATGYRGGRFECGAYARQRDLVKESQKGDVLGLAGRSTAPFPLDRDIQSLSSLQKRVASQRH